jgi:cyclic pyranopterin phosphate synthase
MGADGSKGEDFSHLDDQGRARMVDVGGKPQSRRLARAAARVVMAPETLDRLRDRKLPKGDVLAVARVAAIMAAKDTSRLIPMCHPLAIEHVSVDFSLDQGASAVEIEAGVSLTGKTGVEMEALTAVSVAALTIYDMCKAVDKDMAIEGIRLLEKRGGGSG